MKNFTNTFIFSVFMVLVCTTSKSNDAGQNEYQKNSLENHLRQIGHLLLQQSGDTVSRVLPIRHPRNYVYEVWFLEMISIDPDTLANTAMKSLEGFSTELHYLIQVKQCNSHEIAYSFEVFEDESKNVIPCLGRILPIDCYYLQIIFYTLESDNEKDGSWKSYIFPFIGMLFVMFLFVIRRKSKAGTRTQYVDQKMNCQHKIYLGNSVYCPDKQMFFVFGKVEVLTSREHQVFMLLYRNLNEIVNRDELQKQIWEDEGLVVGRSLDVFISKLRKKISIDPALKIMNIHGRGYKLTDAG